MSVELKLVLRCDACGRTVSLPVPVKVVMESATFAAEDELRRTGSALGWTYSNREGGQDLCPVHS